MDQTEIIYINYLVKVTKSTGSFQDLSLNFDLFISSLYCEGQLPKVLVIVESKFALAFCSVCLHTAIMVPCKKLLAISCFKSSEIMSISDNCIDFIFDMKISVPKQSI